MTSGQKNAVSLLITISLFAAFTMAAFSGLFSLIETRFYQPAKIQRISEQLDYFSESYDEYLNSILKKLTEYTGQKSILTYAEQRAADEDVRERSRLTGSLFNSLSGLTGIRIIDSNARSVHFSTYTNDYLRNSENLRSYKDYANLTTPSETEEIPFAKISFTPQELKEKKYKILSDAENNRLIISFPFYDSYAAYRGIAVFYFYANDFNRELSKKNLITFSENARVMDYSENNADCYGLVFGLPVIGTEILEKQIVQAWKNKADNGERLASYVEQEGEEQNEGYWILFSSRKSEFCIISGIYRDNIFVMPQLVRIVLLVCVFISLFLLVYLIANLKHDDLVIIKSRIRRFQFAVVNEYLNKKLDVDWNVVAQNLEKRKDEVSESIRKSLGARRLKKYSKEIDALLEKSWAEIFQALQVPQAASISMGNANAALQNAAEIKQMLEEILSSGKIKIQAVPQPSRAAVTQTAAPAVSHEAAEIEEVEEADIVEADEVESAESAETVEAVENAEAAESVEELDDIEDIEEIEEIQEADDADAPEAVDEIEEVESIEEAASAEDVEELNEADSVEELEEIEEVESVEDAAEAETEEAKSAAAETVQEAVTADASQDSESPEDVETLEDAEPLAEESPEPLESVESLDTAEPVTENSPAPVSQAEDVTDQFVEQTIQKSVYEVEQIHGFDKDPEITHEYVNDSGKELFISHPDFSELDEIAEPEREKTEPEIASENLSRNSSENLSQSNNIEDSTPVEELTDINGKPLSSSFGIFSFTKFAANNKPVIEAEDAEDAIVEDENGLYHISENLDTSAIKIDYSFKKLVDSVLQPE